MGLRTWIYEKTGIKLKKIVDQKELKRLQEIAYLEQFLPKMDHSYIVKDEFKGFKGSTAALQKLIEEYNFESVLDIGAGAMDHSIMFAKHGKKVTAIDYGNSVYFKEHVTDEGYRINKIIGDFNEVAFTEKYDCIWASHLLEHIADTDSFFAKIDSITNEGSIIAITVPPLTQIIYGGHVSIWNAGLILYRLVLAGYDCSDASILSYKATRWENISVIIRKKKIPKVKVEGDKGDLRKIKEFLPAGLEFYSNEHDDPFNGNIARLNW